jgi:chromosome segregation ATPase
MTAGLARTHSFIHTHTSHTHTRPCYSGTTTKLHEAQTQLKGLEAQEAGTRERLSQAEQELREAREAARRAGQEGKAQEAGLTEVSS